MNQERKRKFQEMLIKNFGNAGVIEADEAFKLMRNVPGFYTSEGYAKASEKYERSHFNSIVRSVEGENGIPLWHHRSEETEDGETSNYYVQLSLFSLEDYIQVGTYRLKSAARHIAVLRELNKQCRKQYRQSLPIQLSMLEEEVRTLQESFGAEIPKPKVRDMPPRKKTSRGRKEQSA